MTGWHAVTMGARLVWGDSGLRRAPELAAVLPRLIALLAAG